MKPASLLAEAVERSEPIHVTRERRAVMDHVVHHYRAIALPALAAAIRRKAWQRGNDQRMHAGSTPRLTAADI